jgi:hypothetical protein
LAGALALALLLTACGSRVRDWPEDAAAPQADDAATATTAPTGHRDDETLATTTVPAHERSNSTATTSVGNAPGPTAAGGIPAPAEGDYQYDVVTHIPAFEDEDAETFNETYTVHWRVDRSAGAVTADEIDSYDDDDPASSYVSSYRTTASTHELLKTTDTDEDGVYTCAYKPALRVFNLPLVRGAKWHSDSACTDEDGTVEHYVRDSEVIGIANDTVGGQAIVTMVVKTTETYTETYSDGDDEPYTDVTETTSHVDAKTLLVVVEDSREIGEGGGTFHRALRSLQPR